MQLQLQMQKITDCVNFNWYSLHDSVILLVSPLLINQLTTTFTVAQWLEDQSN